MVRFAQGQDRAYWISWFDLPEEKRHEFEAANPEITRLARGDFASNEANSRSAMIEGALVF